MLKLVIYTLSLIDDEISYSYRKYHYNRPFHFLRVISFCNLGYQAHKKLFCTKYCLLLTFQQL